MSEGELSGKWALVCGSSQGIGRASAEVLAARGATILLVARNVEALESVRAGLSGEGHQLLAHDFTDPEGLGAALDQRLADLGPIEILVNNTGGPPRGPLTEAGPEDFLRAVRMHVVASQLLLQRVLPGMRQAGYGRVINIISISVKAPIPGLGVSNTTRGAMASWAKTMAGELGPHGITVNNVLPGYTDTARLRSLIAAIAAETGQTENQVIATMKSNVPVGRFASADEIASVVGFLASPAAGYINGINLPVDGGRVRSL